MLAEFLQPVDPESVAGESLAHARSWGATTRFATASDLEGVGDLGIRLALIGAPGNRSSGGRLMPDGGPDRVRRALYPLAAGHTGQRIADLGDILPGETVRDSLTAVREIAEVLLGEGIVPLFVGAGQELTVGIYEAFEKRKQGINLVSVDAHIDLVDRETVDALSWIWHILDREPSYLLQFTQLAYQSHFVPSELIDSMEKLHFEHLRLGLLRDDIRQVEPAVRDADLLSFDLSAIRASDSMAHALSGPNGLFGEEACRIARYAGLSDRLAAIGLFGYEPDLDRRGQTAALLAQMIWYFTDGLYHRKGDVPRPAEGMDRDFTRYTVAIGENGHSYDMCFLKSRRSGRWWMEVPFHVDPESEQRALLPCSYQDYETALRQEVPDRWLKAMHRLKV